MSPSSHSRRSFLAVCGITAFSGCSALANSTEPAIECGLATYDWPMYGSDPGRTGSVGDRSLPEADAEPRRLSRTDRSLNAPPAVHDGTAYVAGDVRVEAVDSESVERKWSFEEYSDGVYTTPVLGCESVYVSGLNETFALDAADGSLQWRTEVGAGDTAAASPVAHDGTLYVAGPSVTALDMENGDQQWHTATEHSVNGVAVDERAYVATGSSGNGAIVALTTAEGEKWWRATGVGSVYAPPAVRDGTVYVASANGLLTALDAADGDRKWQTVIPSGVSQPPAVTDDTVFVTSGNGTQASAFDAATGERQWRFESGLSQSAPVVLGDSVCITGANDGFYLLDVRTGDERWRSSDIGVVDLQPVIADDRIYYVQGTQSEVFVLG